MEKVTTDQSSKKSYQAPRIVEYGDVRDLTKSGAGSKKENKGNDTKPRYYP